MTNEKYLTKTAFAQLMDVSQGYITKLGKQGRLVYAPDGQKIDVAATRALLDRTVDPARQRPDHEEKAAGGSYWEVKTRREAAQAELAELELAQKRGDLVERARVEDAAFKVGRLLRDTIMGLPTQLAPEFASMSDAFEIENKMREALRRVLNDLAKLSASDMDRALDEVTP